MCSYPVRVCTARGRVIVLSVGHSVCLSACLFVRVRTLRAKQDSLWALLATYESEIEILAYKYLTNESVLQGAEKSRLFTFSFALLKLPLPRMIISPAQVNCNQAIVFQASLWPCLLVIALKVNKY